MNDTQKEELLCKLRKQGVKISKKGIFVYMIMVTYYLRI
jgi:hypothetical protein